MKSLPLLLKREYWEHRGGFLWTPVWIAGVMLFLSIAGMITAEVFRSHAHVQMGFSLDEFRANLSAQDFAQAGQALDLAQFMFGAVPCVGLFFVLFFYLLGALYDDRRDRSVLFWKSLPVSDTATVASKALSAMLLAPLVAFAVSTLAYIAFLILITAWTGLHGVNIFPAIFASHPFSTFGYMLMTVPIDALWALPAVGWLLFWSAFVRSKPFLWAVMLPVLALFANWWVGVLGGPHFSGDLHLASLLGRLLLSVFPGSWITVPGVAVDAEHISIGAHSLALDSLNPASMYNVLTTANLWLGVAAGVALIAAAIWMRGRRIEVNV
jgi:ABC-2 type transport system permease protein